MIKSTINDHLINDNDSIFLKYRCSNGFCDLCILIIFFFQTELRKHFTDILQEKLYALRKEAEELHKVRKAEEPLKADR